MNIKYLKMVMLWVGVVGTLLMLPGIYLRSNFCIYSTPSCTRISDFFSIIFNNSFVKSDVFGVIFFTIIFLAPIILSLSLLTYRMKDEVFHAWFNFAKWWVPVIIGVTLFFETKGAGGGDFSGVVSGWFSGLIISFFYIIFITTSLVKIVRAYLRTKRESKNS